MYVHKPKQCRQGFVVRITESVSPLSKLIDEIYSQSRESAWQCYREAKKEEGRFL